MSFDKYWEKLESKNPALSEGENKMTISVESFWRQLRKAYEAGAKDRAEVAKAFESAAESGKPKKPYGDLFGDGPFGKLFG